MNTNHRIFKSLRKTQQPNRKIGERIRTSNSLKKTKSQQIHKGKRLNLTSKLINAVKIAITIPLIPK